MSAAKAPTATQGRRRIAKGPPRPRYLETPEADRLMIMFVAMTTEILALRDRLDTHELLLERDGGLTREAIEAYRPMAEVEAAREQTRMAAMRRIFRVLKDEFETYKSPGELDAA